VKYLRNLIRTLLLALLLGSLAACQTFALLPGPTSNYVEWETSEGLTVLVPPFFRVPPLDTLEEYIPPLNKRYIGDNGENLSMKAFAEDAMECYMGPCEYAYTETYEIGSHILYGMCARIEGQWLCVRRDPEDSKVFHLRLEE